MNADRTERLGEIFIVVLSVAVIIAALMGWLDGSAYR